MRQRHNVSKYVNHFIDRTFRDVADQDYVLARIAFRVRLDIQFIWLAHQAIEKYLKAILLYNRRSTKKLGHDLAAAYSAVCAIDDLPFNFPDTVPRFIEYLDKNSSRYFEFPYHVMGERLLELDETVWHLRRWCENVRGELHFGDGPEAKLVPMFPFEIKKRQNPYFFRHRQKFALFGGFLEDVLQKRRHEQLRSALLWSNAYFSHRRKPSYLVSRWASASPPFGLHPDLIAELEPLVQFSKELQRRIGDAKRQQKA